MLNIVSIRFNYKKEKVYNIVTTRLPSPLDHNVKFGSSSSSGSGDKSGSSGYKTGFKLPPGLKSRLCRALDSPQGPML